jgi:hypothetical protein
VEPWEGLFGALAQGPVTLGGVSSGEGLINAIRDAGEIHGPHGLVHDPGVEEKRLFVNTSEFGSVLTLITRQGSTLSGTMRMMFDCDPVGTSSKVSPVKCAEPYMVMSAAVTPRELTGLLFDKRDAAGAADNGFGNRFLMCWVKRDKQTPHPQPTQGLDAFMEEIAGNVAKVYGALKPTGAFRSTSIGFSAEAKALWTAKYREVDAHAHNAAGANAGKLMERSTVYALKLSGVLAALAGEQEISAGALEAAIAWVEYHAATVNMIAATAGDRLKAERVRADAALVLDALKARNGGARPVPAREAQRRSKLDASRFRAATAWLLQQGPSPIEAIKDEWVVGHGARRTRLLLRLRESPEDATGAGGVAAGAATAAT